MNNIPGLVVGPDEDGAVSCAVGGVVGLKIGHEAATDVKTGMRAPCIAVQKAIMSPQVLQEVLARMQEDSGTLRKLLDGRAQLLAEMAAGKLFVDVSPNAVGKIIVVEKHNTRGELCMLLLIFDPCCFVRCNNRPCYHFQYKFTIWCYIQFTECAPRCSFFGGR